MYVKSFLLMLTQNYLGISNGILPAATIYAHLVSDLRMSPVDIRFAMRILKQQISAQTHNRIDQAKALFLILVNIIKRKVSIRQVAEICQCDHSRLAKALKNERKPHGRQLLLTEDQEEELICLILLYQEQNRPVTISFLRQYINEQFNVQVSSSWHRRFLTRHKDRIRIDTATPQDSKRLEIPREYGKKHIKNLIKYVQGIPTELVFNIDEVGFQRWSDRKKKRVIVPLSTPKKQVHYAVKRSEKRVSIVSTISMAGDTLMPLIISHRKRPDKKLEETGLREGDDFMIEYQKSCFVTKEIFSKYVQSVLFPYIENIRKLKDFGTETAVILCDNCSAHVSDDLLEKMKERNIRLVTFPPHSSHLFQPLDLVTFGMFKMYLKSKIDCKSSKTHAELIEAIITALEASTISKYNRSAFKRAGLKIDTTVSPHRCKIDIDTLNKRIEETMVNQNETILDFSKFGFMNKKYF